MNNSDIPIKTDLGREEIKNQSLGVLPREARILLIMVDGKKPYQSYINSLDESKMFADFGGVLPLFELLLEFQCIEVTEQSGPRKSILAQLASSAKRVEIPRVNKLPPPSPPAKVSAETEFSFEPNEASTQNPVSQDIDTKADYEAIKSDLASYIEKNAPTQDAWGYLLSLEQCDGEVQLLRFVQRIQNAPGGGTLSEGMHKYCAMLNTP